MKLERSLLLTHLLIVLVSVAAHEVGSGQFAFLLVTVVLCVMVWQGHKRGRTQYLGERLATLVLFVVFLLTAYRGLATSALRGMLLLDIRVPAVGQFLIVFQWVYLLRKQRPRDYVWIYMVTVVHMGTAGLLMPGIEYAFFFFLYTMTSIAALSTYNTWLEVRRTGEAEPAKVRVQRRFLLRSFPAALALMLPVALVFMALPRRPGAAPLTPQVVRFTVQPMTGFSQRVELGDIGEIQENPRRVMLVKVLDAQTGESEETPGLLLRGIALELYARDGGRWVWRVAAQTGHWWRLTHRGGGEVTELYRRTFPGFDRSEYERIQCEITLEPLQAKLLFVPFAAESVDIPSDRYLIGHNRTHAIRFYPGRLRPLTYTVVSRRFSADKLEVVPRVRDHPREMLQACLQLPADLSPRVRGLARTIAPAGECPDDYSKAARIQEYLSDPQRFSYTLTMEPTPGVEPVEDFVFNTHRGHCEHFASAMAVLLRCVGVPARLVNGFKVNEWNALGGYHVVRQADAHSWVEAYLRPGGWRTFDPSVMRDDATPQPMFVRRWWRTLYDWSETLWVSHVLNYDSEQQSSLYEGVGAVGGALRRLWISAMLLAGAGSVDFERSSWRWVLGFVMTLLRWVMIGLAVLAVVLLWRSFVRRRVKSGRTAGRGGGGLPIVQANGADAGTPRLPAPALADAVGVP